MKVHRIDHTEVKHSFATHAVPLDRMSGVRDLERPPQIGDLIVAQVLTVGQHRTIEGRSGTLYHIFPGDLIMGAFGNRYATDQFEAYVPKEPVAECDLVSVGGVCGQVTSQSATMDTPTHLRVIGGVCGRERQLLNLRDFGLAPCHGTREKVVLVVGSSMNAGKTTTVGTLARVLKQAGFRVAAAKITGTAAGKDGRYFTSCGARPSLDFTWAGYPSTYLLELDELLAVYHTLLAELAKSKPDYILIEVADGIFQRETRLLLECEAFRKTIHDVFFAAGDSLAIECGVRAIRRYCLPLRATTGVITKSPLGAREAEAATGLPCLSIDRMIAGEALEAMRLRFHGPISPQIVTLKQPGLSPRQNGKPSTGHKRPQHQLRPASLASVNGKTVNGTGPRPAALSGGTAARRTRRQHSSLTLP